jgi:hypothetical protein
MSNKHIAIKWATATVKTAPSFVYSDQFFKPFSNEITRRKISEELAKNGVVVWSDTKEGAFLFRASDTRLQIIKDAKANVKIGAYSDNGNVLMLPPIHA